ncbi:MAG: nucleotidyltransferase domain-containing protein [Chromatocurvus sp.]
MEQQLTEVLARHSQVRLAILFGSQARGQATRDSDIDVGVLAQSSLSAGFKLELMQQIALECGRPVDIVDLYNAGEPVLGQVLKGKRLLGDDVIYAQLLTRHLLDAADFLPLQRRILAERKAEWIN